MEVRKNIFGLEGVDYALSLLNIANFYQDKGNFERAESLLLEALRILEIKLGENNVEIASVWKSLGGLYMATGFYSKALHFLEKALFLRGNIMGTKHLYYTNVLYDIGRLYWLNADQKQGKSYYIEAHEVEDLNMINATNYLTEAELDAYIQEFIYRQAELFSLASIEKGLAKVSFDKAILHKGFILNSTKKLRKSILSDSISIDNFIRLKSYHRRMSNEYAKPIAKRQNVAELEKKANALEKELVRTVAGYGDAIRQVEWEEVRDALQTGEAAVEFIHYDYYTPDPTDSVMYAALVLRPGDETPHFITLFEEKQLTNLLGTSENAKQTTLNKLYKAKENGLHQLIWQPLDSLLKGYSTIYASPSGLLHRINLGAIMKDASTSFGDQHQLQILGSTRQLVVKGQQLNPENLSATIYGGIRYDMDSTAIALALENSVDTTLYDYDDQVSFGYLERGVPERGSSWYYLPATVQEMEAIATEVRQQNGQANTFKGYEATEESFKRIGINSPSPRILHLATHGYFYPDPEEEEKQSPFFSEASAFQYSEHPMIRSGLMMAGGDHVWNGNAAVAGLEDGILTAYEVSQVNLSNTELVVLSACETGLGDIEGNEGVYGLQRAFKIAGAKNLIMSLWTVPDEQTQEMMVLFYQYWLGEDMELEVAFRAAQQEMRRRYEDHYYWASFVLIR